MSATVAGGPPRGLQHTPHLVELIAETERLAQAIEALAPERRREAAAEAADASVLATLRLDGATLDALPDAAALEAALTDAPEPSAPAERAGTWIDAMRAGDEPPDETLQALEVRGARAALAADDLVDGLLEDPISALGLLHGRLTEGLIAPERAGAPRRLEQAVEDASVGRILYFPPEPAAVERELHLLGGWVATTGAREHGLVLSGVLHLELLRIHPYDAANGRLARAAARLALRARRLDPDGLAMPEPTLAADALGYHEEVARTARRQDATIWLERWGEAVTAGLRDRARRLGALGGADAAPERARRAIAQRAAFTIADYRADAGVGPEEARADLRALLDAGLVERVAGSRGLRFVRTDAAGA